ncbi:MAG: phosphocholine cytidylyltransferase family protein [Gammaproteobacteria bacterium]|nr:phosphocholine cytidylyltransferase family protein [Gammaproteobacteria bacterium]
MKVVILAAGVGERLADAAGGKPKCLLEFGGCTLLERHLRVLDRLDPADITIVTGFRQELIQAAVANIGLRMPVNTIINPDFRLGSIVSLWCARPVLESGDDVVVMDADVLYDPSVLQRLFETQYANCFLLDRDFEPGEEPVKVCLRGGRIVEFRKQLAPDLEYDAQGESVGFFRFDRGTARALAARATHYVDGGRSDAPYEEAIRDLVLREPEAFGCEDVTGLPWIEIDFPQDIECARAGILPRISMEI